MLNQILVSVLTFGVAVMVAKADSTNLTLTVNGITYSNVTFGTAMPSKVSIRHSSGIASIPLEQLPRELQKRFGFDPQKAEHYRKAEAQNQAAWQIAEQERLVRLKEQQANAEKLKVLEKDAVDFGGKITGLNDAGLVIQTRAAGTTIQHRTITHGGGDPANPLWRETVASGTIQIEARYAILIGHPRQSLLAIGDVVSCRAYRDGVSSNDGQPLPRWLYVSEKIMATNQPSQPLSQPTSDIFGRTKQRDPNVRRLGERP
jgi:hypothetical protein